MKDMYISMCHHGHVLIQAHLDNNSAGAHAGHA